MNEEVMVKMTKKEMDTIADIVNLILNRNADFNGVMTFGWGTDSQGVPQFMSFNDEEKESQSDKEETLDMAYEYLEKHLLPIPFGNN